MFIRVSQVKRKNKSYSYAQIVESFRNKDTGLPSHKVIANLGQLSDLQIGNLRKSLEASKAHKSVVIQGEIKPKLATPTKNLVYLDLMVLRTIWIEDGIRELLQRIFDYKDLDVSMELMLCILCLHRCIDPGSKLSTVRWFSRTVLPNVLKVGVNQFNNSRIHRALTILEQNEEPLMSGLAALFTKRFQTGMNCFFMDVTDAWFEGRGPKLAEYSLVKDGTYRQRIGIILLCNQEGLPIRWEVLHGKCTDSQAISDLLERLKNFSWIKGHPLVCDRAMGRSSYILKMTKMGVHFITAVARPEYLSFAPELTPVDLEIDDFSNRKTIIALAIASISNRSDFEKVSSSLYVNDCGIIQIEVLSESKHFGSEKKYAAYKLSEAMALGMKQIQMQHDGVVQSFAKAASILGLKESLASNYRKLTKLPKEAQQMILNGEANNCSINEVLRMIAKEDPLNLFQAFCNHVDECNKGPVKTHLKFSTRVARNPPNKEAVNVRVVCFFNPEMYADLKMRGQQYLRSVGQFIEELNQRLSSGQSRRTRDRIYAEIDAFLRKKDLVQCFEIIISEKGKHFIVELKFNDHEWNKRKRYDGFCVIATHGDVALSAAEICKLYRSKDTVEKDFQTIKSQLELSPIRHRVDHKVKAHVSICMLSLLLDRLLERRLKGEWTSARALEDLHSCHLNEYKLDTQRLYSVTTADAVQSELLKTLGFNFLTSEEWIAENIS